MRAHIFLNFIFLAVREKDDLYILSLESVTSIKRPINALKVVYHPVSYLLHHYNNCLIFLWYWFLNLRFCKKVFRNTCCLSKTRSFFKEEWKLSGAPTQGDFLISHKNFSNLLPIAVPTKLYETVPTKVYEKFFYLFWISRY